MALDPTATDAQGALSQGDNSNTAFAEPAYAGHTAYADITPPDGEQYPDFTLPGIEGCQLSLSGWALADALDAYPVDEDIVETGSLSSLDFDGHTARILFVLLGGGRATQTFQFTGTRVDIIYSLTYAEDEEDCTYTSGFDILVDRNLVDNVSTGTLTQDDLWDHVYTLNVSPGTHELQIRASGTAYGGINPVAILQGYNVYERDPDLEPDTWGEVGVPLALGDWYTTTRIWFRIDPDLAEPVSHPRLVLPVEGYVALSVGGGAGSGAGASGAVASAVQSAGGGAGSEAGPAGAASEVEAVAGDAGSQAGALGDVSVPGRVEGGAGAEAGADGATSEVAPVSGAAGSAAGAAGAASTVETAASVAGGAGSQAGASGDAAESVPVGGAAGSEAGVVGEAAVAGNYKTVNITGQSGAGTNYQIRLVIAKSTDDGTSHFGLDDGAANWPYDIQFRSTDGETVYPYWRESSDASYVTVWVKVGADLSTNQSMLCFYGDGGADTSDIDDTFYFGDAFVTLDTTNKWTVAQGSIDVSGGELQVVGTTGTRGRIHGKPAFGAPVGSAIRAKVRSIGSTADDIAGNWICVLSTPEALTDYCGMNGGTNANRVNGVALNSGSSESDVDLTVSDLSTGVVLETCWSAAAVYYKEISPVVRALGDCTDVADIPNEATMTPFFYEGAVANASVAIDWVIVRKWQATEPAFASVS